MFSHACALLSVWDHLQRGSAQVPVVADAAGRRRTLRGRIRPWGPWTTAFYTERWDVGPGETSSFPVKWMSPDGTDVHLVFSGDDAFSVRKATIIRRP